MYGFVTHTWNPIKGRCLHACNYCYMNRIWARMEDPITKIRFPDNLGATLRLDHKEFGTDLGSGNFIFIGSSTDIFEENIPASWIRRILDHIKKYPKNTYLFQTKNPYEFNERIFADNVILGITLETNRGTGEYSKAPDPVDRVCEFAIKYTTNRKMVTIEPIMDFDLFELVVMVKQIKPEWVNIGADSGGNKLPEPPKDKILDLISELEKFTEVKNKSNLKRLLK